MNVFVIADTHFGHRSLVEGRLQPDGTRLKMAGGRHTDFATIEEHDEAMVERWNAIVKPGDKVYHLGDVCVTKKSLKILSRLNGRKTLIAGNHDIFNTKEYLPYFDNMRAGRVFDSLLLTHVPVHPDQLWVNSGRFSHNVHGHTHRHFVDDSHGYYVNACVELWDYTPIPMEVVKELCRE